MRKVILYIAQSLDGYIADRNGKVDWLQGHGDRENADQDSWPVFIEQVDTVVMGWNTYRQITEELSPDAWVYDAQITYVITHRQLPSSEKIRFTDENPVSLISRLQQEAGKAVWICGGARIIEPLMKADLIDEYNISIIPVILGSGLSLWKNTDQSIPLNLRDTSISDGIVQLVYERRSSVESGTVTIHR